MFQITQASHQILLPRLRMHGRFPARAQVLVALQVVLVHAMLTVVVRQISFSTSTIIFLVTQVLLYPLITTKDRVMEKPTH